MHNTIKKFFSFLVEKKSLFLALVSTGLFLVPKVAFAGWVSDLLMWLPTRTALLIVVILSYIVGFFVWLSGFILNWVMSPSFISLSYTNPAGNTIIETGLRVTQGFVNMLLVLVLIYIAIATILRLAGYETKKLLVTFIVVALLVNFSPVICGLIVDASNIVMNFFISQVRADSFGDIMRSKINDIMADFHWVSDSWEGASSKVVQILTIDAIDLALTLVFLIYTVIFIVRYIAIWILVILSPLAFACYILPATKKYFEQWWQQFLAWSFIGVTCGFFLYLGLLVAIEAPSHISPPQAGQGGIFDSILPYIVPIVFLGIGLIFGLKTSAMGAGAAVGWAKRITGGTAKYTGKGTAWAASAVAKRTIGEEGRKKLTGLAAAKALPTAESLEGKSRTGKALTYARSLAALPYWAIKRGVGAAGLKLVESGIKDVKDAENKTKDTTAERKASVIRTPGISTAKRVGALRQAIEEGQTKDIKDLGITDEEIVKIGRHALNTHPEQFKKIRDAFPHLVEKMGKGLSNAAQKAGGILEFDKEKTDLFDKRQSLNQKASKMKPGEAKNALAQEVREIDKQISDLTDEKDKFGTIETKIIANIKPDVITKMDKNGLKTDTALRGASQFWSGNQFKAAVEGPLGKEFLEDFNKFTQQTLKDSGKDFYKKINPALCKYARSSAGQALGLDPLDPK